MQTYVYDCQTHEGVCMIKVLQVLLLVLVLSGCATVKISTNESVLMPDSVAMAIFEKHDAGDWAKNPFMFNIGGPCGTDKMYVDFSEIIGAQYIVHHKQLLFSVNIRKEQFFCPVLSVPIMNVSNESEAQDLTNAARALGAEKLDKLVIDSMYGAWSM